MNQVKLVIWDLDDTFWKGTLSEGPVEIIPGNVELVRTLVQRGIMCSISSKNDFEPAKAELERAGIWDYFIFPVINWNPKGENIKDIISRCQLRAVNVLFVDDNASNRNEAEFYNPGLMTMDAVDLPKLLDDEGLLGKDDSKLSRLKQYKILEQKEVFKTSCSDNTDFLIKSNIRIEYLRDIKANSTRIAELIARTNQLNFTKIRIDESGVLALAENPNYECAAIHVVDNFGDYGVCGFYALNKEHKKLEHFLFSCRILNLGVENFIYQQLGCPQLEIVEPISEMLDASRKVDYISVMSSTDMHQTEQQKHKGEKKKVLLLGGCDLDQVCFYLESAHVDVLTDFNYTSENGQPIHRESTIYLRLKDKLSPEHFQELCKLHFCDEHMLEYNLFTQEYDVLIYSVLMNYTQELYRNKQNPDMVVATGGYNNLFEHKEKFPSEEEYNHFCANYELLGQQTPEAFYDDLCWLYSITDKPILFLNGAEVDIDNPNEVGASEHHKIMNRVLEDFVAKHSDRCAIIDVRKYIQSREDVTDNIRHYKRITYVALAKEILGRLSTSLYDVSYKLSYVDKIKGYLQLWKQMASEWYANNGYKMKEFFLRVKRGIKRPIKKLLGKQ